jgi:uncharacterized protein (TIGR02099 family)
MSNQKNRPVRSLVKYCWYCLAVIVVFTAVIVQSARWMAPSINQMKDSIEAFASRQLNSNVSIGQISATWSGLRPKISIQDLSIQYQSSFIQNQSSNRNKNFLKLKFASLELHILKSLFYWTPVWRDVRANGITAQLVQGKDGRWSLGVPAVVDNMQQRNWRYRRPSSLFLYAQHVTLDDADLTLVFNDQRELKSRVPTITIKNDGHFHRLEAKASVASESSFTFIVEGVGDPSVPDNFFATAYLKLENIAEQRLAQWVSQLTRLNIEQEWVHSSSADVELWFDFASTTRFLVNGHVNLKGVDSVIDALQAQDDNEKGNEWSADIVGGYNPLTGLEIGLRNIYLGESFRVSPFSVNLKDNDKLNIGVETLDLTSLNKWVLGSLFRLPYFNTDELSVSKIKDFLSSLNPKGGINDLYVTIDLKEPKKTKLFANLDRVSTGVWRNFPAFGQVSGYLESDLASGFIVIDAKQFSLFPDKTYDEPIVASTATGVVRWTHNSSEKELTVFGHDLSLQGDYGDAKGYFLLESDWGGANKRNHLDLQLGLKNSKALLHPQLVPRTLPDDLLAWMDTAIKAGEIVNTGVIYSGGFTKTSPRSIQVFVDIEDAALQLDKNWPAVKQLDTNLLIDNNRLFAHVINASTYQDDNFNGEVKWNANSDKLLKINVAGVVPANSVLQYIRESLLKNSVGDIVNKISVKGNVAVKVDLDISLANSSASAKSVARSSEQEIEIVFKDNILSFDQQNLNFNAINGALNFKSKSGFSSEKLQAEFLGKPIFVDVYEDPALKNALIISGKGSSNVESINSWLNRPTLKYLKGDVTYIAKIQLPLNQQSVLQPSLSITSELVGVTSDLPSPFKKLADEKLLLTFKLPFTGNKLIYDLTVGSYFSTKFAFGDPEVKDKNFSAFFSASDTAVSNNFKLPESGIKVLGKFENFSVDEWMPVFAYFSAADDFKDSNNNKKSTLDANLFVSINNMQIKGQVFKNIIFSGEREANGWRVIVDNSDVLGSLTIDDNSKKPMLIELDYLNWPPNYVKSATVANDTDKKTDPLKDLDPSLFPAMVVRVNRLNVLDQPLGRWSFDVLPDKQGVDFRNIYGEVSGFTMTGATTSDGGFLRWHSATNKAPVTTSVYGSVIGKNPKVLFEQWNLPVVLESTQTKIDFDLSWPGSPLAIELETLTGTMTHRYEDGLFSQENIDNSSGLLRVFGLLNFNSWARRVRLDFSDIYKKGFTFDELGGQLYFNNGSMTLTKPLKMTGPSSQMKLSGVIDYPNQSVDAKLEASLPIGGNLTLITALTAGLPAAAGVYLASKIFKKQFKQVSTINYTISGDLNNPNIETQNAKDTSAINADETSIAEDPTSSLNSNDGG